MWFPRRIGPRPPSRVGSIWRAMMAAATFKEWVRFGSGVSLTAVFAALIAAVRFGWPVSQAPVQLKILGWMGFYAAILLLVAIVSTFDVNVKVDASKAGFKGDFSPDDEPATVEATATVTVKPAGEQ